MIFKNSTDMIKASRQGSTAKFPDAVWKTGIPQKSGWVPENETLREVILPKEIVEMSDIQKSKVVEKAEVTAQPEKKKADAQVVKKGGKSASRKQKK